MTVLIEGLVAGTLIGLFARPILDAYLAWRTVESFRRRDSADRERHVANV